MAEVAQPHDPFIPEINAWFFKETSLAEMVRGVKPLASMEDLALDDLTPEETRAFLDAIEE